MGVSFHQKGDFTKTEQFFNALKKRSYLKNLTKYGEEGVRALREATPKDTGVTADSWIYKIEENQNGATISFDNTNIVNGIRIAVILQYGHATRNGGYVTGVDYINPALKPIFDKIAEDAWREVTNS